MTKDYPQISVIIPAWNEEKYLQSLLPCLLTQDYPNCEVIVIDNNSTDNTAKVARSFGVKVVSEKKQGISHARNKGFKIARGEIIIRTDADTMPDKHWVKSYYQEFKENPNAVAITGSSEFFDSGPIINFISKTIFLIVIYVGNLIMGHYPLNGPNFAIRKSVTKKIKTHTNDSVIHEDMDLSCHAKVYGGVMFKPNIAVKTSARRLFRDPLFILKYAKKSFNTYFIHHPSHKLHRVK